MQPYEFILKIVIMLLLILGQIVKKLSSPYRSAKPINSATYSNSDSESLQPLPALPSMSRKEGEKNYSEST